jgi:hypothetical protein
MKPIAGRLWKRANLSIRTPVRDPEGASFSGTFERQIKEGSGNGESLVNLT